MANFLKRYKLTIANNEEVIEKVKPEQSASLLPVTSQAGPIKTPAIGWFLQTIVDSTFAGAPESAVSPTSSNILTVPSGSKARVFTEVQFEAEVAYTTGQGSSSDQDATIKLYNLSKESVAFIKKNYFVFLEAGYRSDSDIPLIFTGQVLKVSTEKQGADSITKLLCKDCGVPVGNIRMCLWYPRGVSYLNIIRDMLARLAKAGVPTGHFVTTAHSAGPIAIATGVPFGADPIVRTPGSGYTTEGKLVQDLIKLCASINYRAYISLGKMYVEPAFGDFGRVFVVELATDQIKTIRPEDDASNETLNSESTSGLKVTAFLDGRISTDKLLKVKDGAYAGLYKITEAKHILSYEGEAWDTEISCTKKA